MESLDRWCQCPAYNPLMASHYTDLKMSELLIVVSKAFLVWPFLHLLHHQLPPASQLPVSLSFLCLEYTKFMHSLLGTFTLRLLCSGVLFLLSFLWLIAFSHSDLSLIVTSEERFSLAPQPTEAILPNSLHCAYYYYSLLFCCLFICLLSVFR